MTATDRVGYGAGVFIIIFGIVIGFTWPFVFERFSKEKLELSPSSETYELWLKTPIPMYLEIYLFNLTNSEEFLNNNHTKPEFEEIGPFVFKEVHQRVNISWNGNSTVSYNQTRTWSFVSEKSVSLSTPIFNLNVIATTVARVASGFSSLVQKLIEFLNAFYKEKLVISKPAREWLFDGIDDKLLDFIREYGRYVNVSIPYDKFGWFYGRNLSSTYDGRFNINTGEDDIFNLGGLEQWNYVNKTKYYEGECGAVKGTSGELFSPVKNLNDNISIFVTDFCGPLTLRYSGPASAEGLNGNRYVGDESVFDNGTSHPEAKCFCTGECVRSGVRNVTSCRQAPLFISFPHFYLADPSYAESVGGMNPNKSEHEFYLSIDPITGIPLEVRAQLQLNVLLRPLKWLPMFKDVPEIYIPMMWFRQRAEVTPDLASRGKALRVFGHLGWGLACGLGFIGLLIIVITVGFGKFRARRKNFELLITPEETKEEEPPTGNNESER